ncbi:hypothetical protein ACGFOU_17965 [Streptomyces sp. NPDC048595]|uniref:hypothetical protein n=1 Tax=Streptomyces sp. NPDC048595 TaxID=3365576 RepID=UPI0037217DA3
MGLQLAGGADEARRIVGSRVDDFRRWLTYDYVFLAGYTISLVAAFVLCRHTVARHRRHKGAALVGVWAACAAGACDVAENLVALWPGGKLTLHAETTTVLLPVERVLVGP